MTMNRQRLGWIGASIAAGIFPTVQMTFAPKTLASHTGSEGGERGDAPRDAGDVQMWTVQATNFSSGDRAMSSAG
jgi:hypothetical protein